MSQVQKITSNIYIYFAVGRATGRVVGLIPGLVRSYVVRFSAVAPFLFFLQSRVYFTSPQDTERCCPILFPAVFTLQMNPIDTSRGLCSKQSIWDTDTISRESLSSTPRSRCSLYTTEFQEIKKKNLIITSDGRAPAAARDVTYEKAIKAICLSSIYEPVDWPAGPNTTVRSERKRRINGRVHTHTHIQDTIVNYI